MARLEERMVAVAWREEPERSLEAVWKPAARPGGRGAVVAAPHPLYGGSMDSPVVNELAHACSQAGVASLRFNWRGVGASTGEPSGAAADADADVDAALAHLAETVPGRLVACGYSYGAAAVLRAAVRWPRVARLVLVAPPPPLLGAGALASAGRPLLVMTGSEDHIAPAALLEEALENAPAARLRTIPGADHFFASGLAAVGREVQEWLRQDGADR